MMKRQFGRTMVTLAAAAMLTAGLSVTALAAEGEQKNDGNWYFFEFVPDSSRGIMYAETQTPDGYMTDAEGVIQ